MLLETSHYKLQKANRAEARESKLEIDMSEYKAGFYFIYTNEKGYRQLINKVMKVSH